METTILWLRFYFYVSSENLFIYFYFYDPDSVLFKILMDTFLDL